MRKAMDFISTGELGSNRVELFRLPRAPPHEVAKYCVEPGRKHEILRFGALKTSSILRCISVPEETCLDRGAS